MSLISTIAKGIYSADKFITNGAVVKKIINSYIQEYGKVLELTIEPKNKYIYLHILLNGESEAVEISVTDYSFNDNTLIIHQASCTKQWIEAILKNFIVNEAFVIDDEYAHHIKEFLT